MEVLAVTLFISVLLALVFIVSFLSESRRQKGWRCADRDALLPLDDDRAAAGEKAIPDSSQKQAK